MFSCVLPFLARDRILDKLKRVDYRPCCLFLYFSTAEQAGCQHFLNAQAEEFIPSLRALDGFKTNDSNRLELGYALR